MWVVPKMDRMILESVRSYFIEKDYNAPALASLPDAVAGTKRAQTLDEFMQAAVPFAGCSSMGLVSLCLVNVLTSDRNKIHVSTWSLNQ